MGGIYTISAEEAYVEQTNSFTLVSFLKDYRKNRVIQ